MAEKESLEHATLQKFIDAYNAEHGDAPLHLVRMGDAPDGIVRMGPNEIGIEIAHVYGTDFDARNRLGRAGDVATIQDDASLWKRHIDNATIPLDQRILTSLKRVLKKKAQKQYGGDCWLLLRNAFPLWAKSDFLQHMNRIQIPEHEYDQIWLLCGQDSSDGILRLY